MASEVIRQRIDDVERTIKSALRPGVGNTLRKDRLKSAFRDLMILEKSCKSDNDTGIVRSKLLGLDVFMLAVLEASDPVKQDLPELLYHVQEMLEAWTWLHRNPQHCSESSAYEFRSTLRHLALDATVPRLDKDHYLRSFRMKLEQATRSCDDPFLFSIKFEMTYAILESQLQQALRLFESGQWALAMSLLKSSEAELDVFVESEEKGAKSGVDDVEYAKWGMSDYYLPGKAAMLKREYEIQLSICNAMQLLNIGDRHFEDSMRQAPEDMMSYALLAQDDYRAALGHVVGQDLELEGAVLTRLARFHAKLLKLPVVAHQLYLRAIQLASTLAPAIPKGQWYRECVDAVQAHRDALEAEELKQWEALKKPILEKLEGELKKLSDAKPMSNLEFAKFIFKEWPPKTEGPTEVPSDPENPSQMSKKALLKVIQRYHVDKNRDKGDEWRVMSEEISKALTARYNVMKGL